jgi:hypothetical protein
MAATSAGQREVYQTVKAMQRIIRAEMMPGSHVSGASVEVWNRTLEDYPCLDSPPPPTEPSARDLLGQS